MIISVVSPHARTGKTTFSTLLAQCLGLTQNLSVLLLSACGSTAMSDYVGIEYEEDITAQAGQVVELVQEEVIAPKDIPDYCKKLSTNCEYLDTSTESFAKDDMYDLVSKIAEKSDRDMVVVECDDKPIKGTDITFVVLNEDRESIKMCKRFVKEKPDPNTLFVVQRYDKSIVALREIAKELGIPYRYCGKLSLSKVLERECRKKKLDTVMPYIIEKEVTVLELNIDFKECMQFIMSTLGQKAKWNG